MGEKNTVKKIDKKTVIVIVIAIVCVAIIVLSAVIAGHAIYERNSEAKILNYNTAFKAISPQILTYYYEDGTKSIDFAEILELSPGASFFIDKIQDEDKTVTKGTGTVIDVSEYAQRLAVVRVVSKNGVGKTDYRITVVPKSAMGNVIEFNATDAEIDLDDIFFNYSGNYAVEMPKVTKTYTTYEGHKYEYDFMGWYTTEDYQEGTEIDTVEKGTTGEVKVYARFADTAAYADKSGRTYITFGNYPQARVKNFAESQEVKQSSAYTNCENGSSFYYTYSYTDSKGHTVTETKRYYKFKPNNIPNINANGFNAETTYLFYVQPVEWLVLNTSGNRQTLLSNCILNGSPYSSNDETLLHTLYDKVAEGTGFSLDKFIRYYFDGDTMYGAESSGGLLQTIKFSVPSNALRTKTKGMVNGIFTSSELGKIEERTFTRYTSVFNSDTDTYKDKLWNLSYSEAISASFGFSTDYRDNDSLRKANVTDFAAANGVYTVNNLASDDENANGDKPRRGSWWLRGAGGTSGMQSGNSTVGYGYKDKRIAYVKYSGYVHAFGTLNYNIISGIRPACYYINN